MANEACTFSQLLRVGRAATGIAGQVGPIKCIVVSLSEK